MSPNFVEKTAMYAASIAERLVGEEMLTKRVKRPAAREIVAREAGITPGSLESLARGRLKYTDRIASKLNALFIRKIERQIISLQHELELAKQTGRTDPVNVERAEAAIQEAWKALGKE